MTVRIAAVCLAAAVVSSGCLISTEEALVEVSQVPESAFAPTETPVPTPAEEPVTEPGQLAIDTAAATRTPEPTLAATPTPTSAPSPTANPLPSPTPMPTAVEATAVPTPEPTETPAPTPTPTPESESTATPEPTPDLLSYTDAVDVDCPSDVADPAITCRRITLPEDDADPVNGRLIELLVALVDNGDPRGIGPVVVLQGGPGVGAVANAKDYVGAEIDVIAVDQRGTGGSTKSLDCVEQVALHATRVALDSRDAAGFVEEIAANRACRDRLVTDGVRPSAYNTEQNADDIALLRQVLGYEEWNLYGTSYGTRLALTVMRDHPEGVRAVVLEAVLPLEVDFFGEIPANAERVITALNDRCAADADCVATYGDVVDLLNRAADQLDAQPQTVSVTRPTSADAITVVVDGPRLRSFVFNLLYRTEEIPGLLRKIQLAADGDVSTLAIAGLSGIDPEGSAFAEGMYWSVFCQDEVTFHDPASDDAVLARQPESFRVAHEWPQVDQLCEVWDVDDAPAVEDQPVVSDLPTLILSGGLDPITPPRWAESVAASLPNSALVSFPIEGHGATDIACVGPIFNAFLSDPTATPDSACASSATFTFD